MRCFVHQGMESKDILAFVLLLVSIFGNALGLRCYSCTTEGSKCSYTIGCHGECYKATAKRIITDVTKEGREVEITEVGCIANCSIEEQRKLACYKDSNCKINCCNTDYCNPLMSNDTGFSGSLGYPNCHSCSSTESYEDCEASSSLSTCSYTAGTAYCYKMDYKSIYGTKKRIYKKGCVRSYTGCDSRLRTAYCSGENSADCNLYCCSGNACNAGAGKRVSVLLFLTFIAVALSYCKTDIT